MNLKRLGGGQVPDQGPPDLGLHVEADRAMRGERVVSNKFHTHDVVSDTGRCHGKVEAPHTTCGHLRPVDFPSNEFQPTGGREFFWSAVPIAAYDPRA